MKFLKLWISKDFVYDLYYVVSYNFLRLLISLYFVVFMLVDVLWSWWCVVYLVGLGVVFLYLWRWDEDLFLFMYLFGFFVWGILLLWILLGIYVLLFDVLFWWVLYYIINVIGNLEKIYFFFNFENWFGVRVFFKLVFFKLL